MRVVVAKAAVGSCGQVVAAVVVIFVCRVVADVAFHVRVRIDVGGGLVVKKGGQGQQRRTFAQGVHENRAKGGDGGQWRESSGMQS